jgi:sulfate adenylyltransferase subunit 1 (EFTu-like GTPase family)
VAFRFPVQRVVRPNLDFRGYAGTVAAGTVKPGGKVTILPSGRETTIARIVTFDGDLAEAEAGQSVTLTLAEEIDLSRGDMIVASADIPYKAHAVEATLVWLNESAAEPGKRYRLKNGARQDWATLKSIERRLNINNWTDEKVHTLEMNAIGAVTLETARLICFDLYDENRGTGSFILIDPATNATVAAGMITGAAETSTRAPLAGISWRIENGALVLTSEAVRHLLRRLRIHPFAEEEAAEASWEI